MLISPIPINTTNRWLVGVLSISGTIIGFLLIILSRFTIDLFYKDLMFGIGLALAPSGVLGLIGDYLIFGRTMETLNVSNVILTTQVEALRISTDFLKHSNILGLEMVYPDRETALKDFAPLMREQASIKGREGKLIIVGSSVKGMVEVVRDLDEIIRAATDNEDCNLRILLTHPKYSRFRENQEERPPGAIEDEIFNNIRFLENIWGNCKKYSEYCTNLDYVTKLYKGTPTCFMIIAGDRMLINPYPYEREAYKSFCLHVRKVDTGKKEEGIQRSIYEQYYQTHFLSPWERNALPYKHYFLQGPIPDSEWLENNKFGDLFVVQDAGEFYISAYLKGDKTFPRGIPTCIPYRELDEGIIKSIKLGNEFSLRLLKITDLPEHYEWIKLDDMGTLKLDNDRRTGKFSGTMKGNFLNEYQMIGLFQESFDSPFKHADFAKSEVLKKQSLPLFWYWFEDRPKIHTSEKMVDNIDLSPTNEKQSE